MGRIKETVSYDENNIVVKNNPSYLISFEDTQRAHVVCNWEVRECDFKNLFSALWILCRSFVNEKELNVNVGFVSSDSENDEDPKMCTSKFGSIYFYIAMWYACNIYSISIWNSNENELNATNLNIGGGMEENEKRKENGFFFGLVREFPSLHFYWFQMRIVKGIRNFNWLNISIETFTSIVQLYVDIE